MEELLLAKEWSLAGKAMEIKFFIIWGAMEIFIQKTYQLADAGAE